MTYRNQVSGHQIATQRLSRRSLLYRSALLGVAAATSGGVLAGCNLDSRLEQRRAEREAEAATDNGNEHDSDAEERVFPELELAEINGVELAVWDSGGDGEPVVFIHGAKGEECLAVLAEPILSARFRLIHYNRRGWGNSPQAEAPTSIEQRAEDCRAVMDYFGVERAHIEGQSAGGQVALQMAIDYPDAVQSLALLEPALPEILDFDPQFMGVMGELIPYFEEGDFLAVAEGFGLEVIGEANMERYLQNMPEGTMERWAEEMETLFLFDVPGTGEWGLTEDMARLIDQPVLNMGGAESASYWVEISERVASLLPHAENVTLPNSEHGMLGTEPEGAALQLAAFFARHPIRA
jgi:pimeloyl-ACP methyl ester carboxylesterase